MCVLEKYEIRLYYQCIFCDYMFHAMIHCEYLAITNVHLQSYFTLVRGFHCIAVKFLSIHHWWIGNGWFLFLKYHCIVTCNIYWAPTMYQVLSKCFTFTISSALHTTHWWGRHCYYAQGNESQRGRSYDAGGHHVGEQQSRDSRPSLSDSKSSLQPCHQAFLIGW